MLRRLLCLSAFLMLSAPALAQDVATANVVATPPTLPPMDAKLLDDGEPIRLSPDGPAVINLDRDAATVIIGNPNHASAVMENPRMIMLMPLQPGATKIMALDREGKSILNRHVLVGGGKSGFMRINRVCAIGTGKACAAQSVYYCPDRCYETTVNSNAAGASAAGGGDAPAPLPDPAAMAPDVVE